MNGTTIAARQISQGPPPFADWVAHLLATTDARRLIVCIRGRNRGVHRIAPLLGRGRRSVTVIVPFPYDIEPGDQFIVSPSPTRDRAMLRRVILYHARLYAGLRSA